MSTYPPPMATAAALTQTLLDFGIFSFFFIFFDISNIMNKLKMLSVIMTIVTWWKLLWKNKLICLVSTSGFGELGKWISWNNDFHMGKVATVTLYGVKQVQDITIEFNSIDSILNRNYVWALMFMVSFMYQLNGNLLFLKNKNKSLREQTKTLKSRIITSFF